MNSINANLFLAIQLRLASIVDNDNNSILRTIDHDMQQLNFDEPPISFPAGLIGSFNFNFTNEAENVQIGMGSITINLVFRPFSPSTVFTPQEFKEKAIAYYDLEQLIHLKLQGWSPSYLDDNNIDLLEDITGKMIRTNARSLPRNDDIIVRQLTYSLTIEDTSAKPTRNATPKPNLKIEML